MEIKYLVFRGTGKFEKNVGKLPGLIIAGHVGLQFEDDPVIYGFHPTAEAEQQAGGEEALLKLLQNWIEQPGCVQDDTAIFLRARDKENLEVVYETYDFPEDQYRKKRDTLYQWYNEEKEFWYNLPNEKAEGGFPEGQYNCSTFPMLLGIPVPNKSGYNKNVIKDMKEAKKWEP